MKQFCGYFRVSSERGTQTCTHKLPKLICLPLLLREEGKGWHGPPEGIGCRTRHPGWILLLENSSLGLHSILTVSSSTDSTLLCILPFFTGFIMTLSSSCDELLSCPVCWAQLCVLCGMYGSLSFCPEAGLRSALRSAFNYFSSRPSLAPMLLQPARGLEGRPSVLLS